VATAGDWARSQRWAEATPGLDPEDEIVGFIDNQRIDDQGGPLAYTYNLNPTPTYDGEPVDPALFYGGPDPRPVTGPGG
jgi:hypothetical protein